MKETKHRSARWALGAWALVLAAAVALTGCGGASDAAAPAGPSAAADQSSASSRSTPGAAALAAQTDRITDQYTLEKNVSGVWGEDAVQYISVHVPKLECDSPDAVSLNKELAAIYAADFREYEAYEEAGQPGGEYPQIGVGWDAYWYGGRLRQPGGAQPLRRHRPVALQRLVLRFCHRQADHHSRDAAADGAGPGRSAAAGAAAGHAGL